MVRGRRLLHARPGDLVSLLAIGGSARGVSTEGLRYPLNAANLASGSSWGVSNAFLADWAAVTVTDGVIVAVQPGEAAPPAG